MSTKLDRCVIRGLIENFKRYIFGGVSVRNGKFTLLSDNESRARTKVFVLELLVLFQGKVFNLYL